jgi:hypothetical protein
MSMRILISLALCCFAFVGCGSSGDANSAPPPLPFAFLDAGDPEAGTERYLPDLTQAERETLCDWAAGTMGGYGKVTACNGATVVNFKTRAACLAQYLGACTSVTVLEYEACIKLVGADVCSDALYKAPECHGIEKCIGKLDGGPPPEPPADGG